MVSEELYYAASTHIFAGIIVLFILVGRNIIICADHELPGIRLSRRKGRLHGRGSLGLTPSTGDK